MIIDNEWKKWIVRNRLLGQYPSSILEAMVANGIDKGEAVQVLSVIERDPIFLAAIESKQYHRKLESVVHNLQKLWETNSNYMLIDRVSKWDLSLGEFKEKYANRCRPLIVTDMAKDWPAMDRWQPEMLKRRFGHVSIQVQSNREQDPNFEENKIAHQQMMLFGDFIDQVCSLNKSNDLYLTANNEILRQAEFSSIHDDITNLPVFIDVSRLSSCTSFWVGPKGTSTPLHHDTVMLFHTQILGSKRWRLISPLETPHVYNTNGVFSPIDLDNPDYIKYPLFKQVKILDVVVNPGESIFLPLGWWHAVDGLELSVSLSMTNITASANHFDYDNPASKIFD